MKIIPVALLVLFAFPVVAQETEKMRENARAYVRQGDYSNAKLILNRALQLKPDDASLRKDLAHTHYLSGDLTSARDVIMPLLDASNADVQAFQIAANVYKGAGDAKECEKIYRKGLKKFPNSGALHFEFGEVQLTQQKPAEAIRLWEDGIRLDPAYPGNYYHAAKYYYYTGSNPILSIVYGEIFVNSESYTVRTAEIKNVLLESYKIFYAEEFDYSGKNTNPFQQAVAKTLENQRQFTADGITADALGLIRTRFLVEWFGPNAQQFPHRLFDHLQHLLREDLFEAYNQWLFGEAEDAGKYRGWVAENTQKAKDFSYFQKNRVFRMPPGQYYR